MSTRTPEHIQRQQEENVQFLIQTGSSLEEACRRSGITMSAYEKRHQPARTTS